MTAKSITAPSAPVPITMAVSISVSPSGLFGLGANIFQRPEANRKNSRTLTYRL